MRSTDLAPFGIRDGDDRGLVDLGMLDEAGLDFRRVDVLAA